MQAVRNLTIIALLSLSADHHILKRMTLTYSGRFLEGRGSIGT